MRITFDKYDEIMPLKKLKKNKFQRNKHPQDQIIRLAKIMETHGVRHPIHISKLSGQVCFGHGRWEAAKLNGWDSFPVVYQDFKDEDEEYACVQSDNAIAHWAELDLSSINNDLQNLGPDFVLDLLGIKDFVLEPADKLDPGCDEDEVPTPTDTRCKLGDVWQLGRHRLVCGDSTDVCAVDLLMAGEKADMVFTDPPYGMNLDAEGFKDMPKAKGTTAHDYKNVIGDHEDFKPELINTVLGVFSYCAEIFLWGADYYADLLPNRNEGSWVVWDKRQEGGTDKLFGSSFELCWSKARHKRDIARILWAGYFGMSGEDSKTRIHPTQKPTKLAEWFFERWGESDDTVVDLFGGSGSTLIACEKTNRRCFMMELDPHYCDVILARWEKYTGKKAEQIEGQQEATKSKPQGKGRKAKGSVKRRAGKKPSRDQLLSR